MNKVKVNYKSSMAYYELAYFLKDYMTSDTVILCIGTDKFIGDCLGPLVGTFLKKENFPLPIYGTLESPCHALNLSTTLDQIRRDHPSAYIIGIDACIGDETAIGELQARDIPIHPGKGVGKILPKVGDASIIGIVDNSDGAEFFKQKNIRLSLVMNMALVIQQSLFHAYYLVKTSNHIN